jgi:hydroxymethylbilane synthase
MATAPPATNILPPHKKSFDIGTRKSKLALAQTDLVVEALSKAFPGYEFNIKSKDTVADLDLTTALPKFVSKNLWTEEFEDMLAAGQLDLIVHSLKGRHSLLSLVTHDSGSVSSIY